MALEPRAVALNIERLVVDGFAVERKSRFLEAFEQECRTALAAGGGALAAPARIDISLPAGASAEDLARAVARAVVRSVRGA